MSSNNLCWHASVFPYKAGHNTMFILLQELNDYIERVHEELEDLHVQFDALSKEHKVHWKWIYTQITGLSLHDTFCFVLLFQQQHILYFYVDSQQVFVFSQVFPSLPSHFTYHVCFKIRVVKFSLFFICLNPLYPQSFSLPVNLFSSRMVWFFVKNHVSLVLWLITKYFFKDITNAFSFQLLSFPKSSYFCSHRK